MTAAHQLMAPGSEPGSETPLPITESPISLARAVRR